MNLRGSYVGMILTAIVLGIGWVIGNRLGNKVPMI